MSRIVAALLASALGAALLAPGQEIVEQKKAVGFLFGTVHPRNQQGGPLTDTAGKPLAVETPLGTAFFVSYPDPRGGPGWAFVYLVTAKHVLQDADGMFLREAKLRLNLRQPSADRQFDLIAHVPVSDGLGNLLWFQDAVPATDVAVLPFLPDLNKYDVKLIPLQMFADEDLLKREKVAEGDSLYFIGLMSQYYGESKNYPVVRRGTLALMTEEEIDTPTGRQHAFIAELTSWPGNSGSPVFLNLAGLRQGNVIAGMNLHLLGVLSGSFLNRVRGTTVEAATVVAGNELNTGISFIIPAIQIKRILDSQLAQRGRDEQIQRLSTPK